MTERKELSTLTTPAGTYDSFPDQAARETLGKIPEGFKTKIPGKVGQIFEIAAVDEEGNVTGVQAVDKPDVSSDSGQYATLYIGPDEPAGDNRPTYWLDTSEDEAEPEITLTGISATYSGGDVAVGTALSALTGIVVTATYSDGSTESVTGYTLSGEIVEGSNTITATYEGMTATFTVTGVAESGGEEEPDVTTYSITNNLTNVTSDNAATSVEENASYTATLTAAKGYALGTVTVTMGGTDITATAYTDGVVSIAAVTGDVVILAIANSADDGTITYYIPDVAVSSTASDEFTTYVVENVKAGDTFRVCVPAMIDAEGAISGDGIQLESKSVSENNYTNHFAELTSPASFGRVSIKAGTAKVAAGNDCAWVHNPNADDIWMVKTTLTNVTSSNAETSVAAGAGYAATITPNEGYKMDIVTVTMGGTDITATAYADGVVSIAAVTGTVKITANAILENIYYLADISAETTVPKTNYETYKIEGVKTGDIIRLAAINADNRIGWSDGTTTHQLNDTEFWDSLTFRDNYVWKQATWTADQDYDILWLTSYTAKIATLPNSRAHIERAVS